MHESGYFYDRLCSTLCKPFLNHLIFHYMCFYTWPQKSNFNENGHLKQREFQSTTQGKALLFET